MIIQFMYDIPSHINQDIKYVDTNTWKVYEHFKINGQNTINQLGFFNDSFHYIPIESKPFVERRSNFQGYQLKAMTDEYSPFTSINMDWAIYDEKSQTYDVTHSMKGMLYDLFMIMQESLNFSATLHKRQDGKWGPTFFLPNGTVQPGGIIESVTSKYAEMIVGR